VSHGYPPTVEVARRILLGANTKNSRRYPCFFWNFDARPLFRTSSMQKKTKNCSLRFSKVGPNKSPPGELGFHHPLGDSTAETLAGAQCWAAHDEIRLELCIFHVLDSVDPDGAVLLPRPWRNCHKKTWNIGIYMIYPVISRSSSLYTFVQLVCGYESMRTVLSA
jgi:hypothetical protein